jgi:RimJ/RimL family protein N-acetyltransferase
VLAWDGERLAGFAEWFVVNDEPIINSIVAARSHWGTPAAPAAGTRAMQRLFDLGYRTLISAVSSRNAPSYAIHLRHGWRRVGENSRNYVRRF